MYRDTLLPEILIIATPSAGGRDQAQHCHCAGAYSQEPKPEAAREPGSTSWASISFAPHLVVNSRKKPSLCLSDSLRGFRRY